MFLSPTPLSYPFVYPFPLALKTEGQGEGVKTQPYERRHHSIPSTSSHPALGLTWSAAKNWICSKNMGVIPMNMNTYTLLLAFTHFFVPALPPCYWTRCIFHTPSF